MAQITVPVLHWVCDRCGHKWKVVLKVKTPVVCPRCKSPYWNMPRKEKTVETVADSGWEMCNFATFPTQTFGAPVHCTRVKGHDGEHYPVAHKLTPRERGEQNRFP